MEASKFLSSSSPVSSSLVTLLPRTSRTLPLIIANASRGGSNSGSDHYGGKLVDDNMIVLRMRIQEKKMLETSHDQAPSDWMEWEKDYYNGNGYNEDVCEAMGLLQNYLMNVRPGLALGIFALVSLSVFLSTGLVLFHSVEMAKMILSGLIV